jgi:threonine aldolase
MNSNNNYRPISRRRQFASDNYSGICPEAWETLSTANLGHAASYGDDSWTEQASDVLREVFDTDCEVFFVFTGTAANALALASLCLSYHSIICHERAHVETDECGAPEFFSNGTKILTASGEHGKIDPQAVANIVHRRADIHFPKPRVLSISQATEMGTVYSIPELHELGDLCRRLNLKMHMDGARLANAIVSLDVAPKDLTWEIGVDVLCFGGSKNGLPLGEAVIFFQKDAAAEFAYRCKQAGQLASKMRFLAAPWVGLLKTGTWLANARHANQMAARLEHKLRAIPGIEILCTRQSNSVFARFPLSVSQKLRERGWQFYEYIAHGGARLMCSWDTKDEEIQAITDDLCELMEMEQPGND